MLTHSQQANRRKLQTRASIALLAWSLLYAFPHLYWGLGGTGGLSILKPSAPEGETFEAANIFAFFFIGAAGFLGFVLQGVMRRTVPWLIPLSIIAIGAAVALSHGAYGILFRIEQWTGLREVDGVPFDRDQHGWVLWDLFVIEPWFVVEGVILWVVGYLALLTVKEQRIWKIATVGLTLAAFLSAAASLKV